MGADLQRQSGSRIEDGGDEIIRQLLLRNRLEQAFNSLQAEASFRGGIGLIHFASKCRILRVADKLGVGSISDEPIFVEPKPEISLPEVEKWDFKLGDKVRIKYSMEDFQSIQDRTFGWAGKLGTVHGHEGIVIGVSSEYDNALNVLFPDAYSGFSLYAGLFEKVEDSFRNSRWKIGDMVKTQTDMKIIKVIQQGLEDIPLKFLGEKGRVVGVTRRYVNVTFDEQKALQIHSALLYPSDDKSPIEVNEPIHSHEFHVGEKVRMKSNLKNLIKTQEGQGGWNPKMAGMRGKVVTVVRLLEDNSLLVQMKHDRPWRVSSDSLIKLDKTEDVSEQDLDFLPGDVIKLNVPSDIGGILMSNNIPLAFMEYLKLTATVASVDDDIDFLLEFNKERGIVVNPSVITKASPAETKKHKEIQDRVESLKTGDTVYLDVGPARYVRAILTTEKADADVITAMTESSTLLGFINNKTAVVKYENGRKYKINKKYLTVPERFQIEKNDDLTELLNMMQRFSIR